jgi:hypothetical protein
MTPHVTDSTTARLTQLLVVLSMRVQVSAVVPISIGTLPFAPISPATAFQEIVNCYRPSRLRLGLEDACILNMKCIK